ncbi:Protein priA [Leucoagaricus sp. SymC.cos]|nr:Protein priA [Leucoagaricus sp. SymC.cos]
MRFLKSFVGAAIVVGLGLGGGVAASDGGGYSDTCAQVNSVLKVPQPLIPKNLISVGTINACICLDSINAFVDTNAVAIAGVALAGKSYVVSAITSMVQSKGKVCNYPDHAVATCKSGSPCYFDCKDGYHPYPSTNPTQCVCNKPYTECNGKCGLYQGCPSGKPQYRRDLSRNLLCPVGMEACGIWGRSARTWECIDTMNDLESCGGCVIPLPGRHGQEGQDCTALPGVSDVSCMGGRCVVHKCTASYEIAPGKEECLYNEDKDPEILAAQYGLEHIPLGSD